MIKSESDDPWKKLGEHMDSAIPAYLLECSVCSVQRGHRQSLKLKLSYNHLAGG